MDASRSLREQPLTTSQTISNTHIFWPENVRPAPTVSGNESPPRTVSAQHQQDTATPTTPSKPLPLLPPNRYTTPTGRPRGFSAPVIKPSLPSPVSASRRLGRAPSVRFGGPQEEGAARLVVPAVPVVSVVPVVVVAAVGPRVHFAAAGASGTPAPMLEPHGHFSRAAALVFDSQVEKEEEKEKKKKKGGFWKRVRGMFK